jgi:predicted Na+-dependent transporter
LKQAQLGLSLLLGGGDLRHRADLKVADVKAALRAPRALANGLVSHNLLFPALTFLLIEVVRPAPSIGLGMLLVSSCPAGHISNFFIHRALGNAALSTPISTLSTLPGGCGLARLLGLQERDRRAVAFETGIQNSGLGPVLVFNFLGGLGGMAIVTA